MSPKTKGLCLFLTLICLTAAFPSLASALPDDPAKEVRIARINISGALEDTLPPDNPFGPSPMYFKKLVDLIRKAADDKEIKAIELKVSSPAIGFGKVVELNKVIAEFKDSGKKVFGYAEALGMKDLMLMSHCDYLAIPESGAVEMPGLSIEVMYYRDFFKKLGLKFLVEHIGDYKSAYENYSREGMSDENREVLNILLDEFYCSIVEIIAENRGIRATTVMQAIDQGLMLPKKALEFGLVDEVCYHDQYEARIKEMLKTDEFEMVKKYGRSDKDLDLENPIVLFAQIMSSMKGGKKKESKNPKIALIYAAGPIMSGKNSVDFMSGQVTIGSDTLSKAFLDAAKDDTVKAIVLRVNSPGGSGLASDIIWRAQAVAKAKKPIIVSMADVAGSGGYYISMIADMILAEPTTITGSIGVVSALPNVSGTLDKLGIKLERLKKGRNAGAFSPFAPADEVNLGMISSYMESFYWDFVDKVAAGRKMTREQVHAIAQGRVWTGRQALKNGLVDALGGMDEAIEIAKLKAGLTDDMKWELKEMPKPVDFFESFSESLGVKVVQAVARAAGLSSVESLILEQPEVKRRLGRLLAILGTCRQDRIQLLMPMDVELEF